MPLNNLHVSIFAIISAGCFYGFILLLAYTPFRNKAFYLLNMPTPSTRIYLSPLDAFRGLAALWVALFHIWQWPRPSFDSVLKYAKFIPLGEKSVPIFVILSGFLIYRSLKKVDTIDHLQKYAIRRAIRIFPLYIVTILLAFTFMRFDSGYSFIKRFIAEATMLHSIGYERFVNPQTWSLYVEVLFYTTAPIFIIVFRKRLLFWTISGLAIFIAVGYGASREIMLWKYFFFGMLTCELFDIYCKKITSRRALLLFALGAALLLFDLKLDWFSILIGRSTEKIYTVGLGVAMSVIIFGVLNSGSLSRFFALWPFHYLGVISYSIFLWHSFIIAASFPIKFTGTGNPMVFGNIPPVPAFVLPLIMLPALLFWATVSFLIIERPFLKKRP